MLRILFTFHAVATFGAGLVLVVAPRAIPSTVGIHLQPAEYLLCYLLAAAEFAMTAVSWGGRTVADHSALRLTVR